MHPSNKAPEPDSDSENTGRRFKITEPNLDGGIGGRVRLGSSLISDFCAVVQPDLLKLLAKPNRRGGRGVCKACWDAE